MKIYVRASANKHDYEEYLRLVKEGIDSSELAGHDPIFGPDDIFRDFLCLKLKGASLNNMAGDDREFQVYFDKMSDIPDEVKNQINTLHSYGVLRSNDEEDEYTLSVNKAKNAIKEINQKLANKYDSEIKIEFSRDDLLGNTIKFYPDFSKFEGTKVDTYKHIKYKNYEMRIYLPYEYSSWNIKKDYNYNLNNIKKGWELLHRAVNDWKYTIDTLDMNLVEDQIKDDIELFQSKYQSTFPGIKISNLKITETIADDVISYYNKYIENGARDVSEHSDWEVSFIFKFNDNRYKIYLYNYEIEQSSFEDALLQAIEELT
mgnify:CR=1 FL=1